MGSDYRLQFLRSWYRRWVYSWRPYDYTDNILLWNWDFEKDYSLDMIPLDGLIQAVRQVRKSDRDMWRGK